MEDFVDVIKSAFSPIEKKAHDVLKEQLWVIYPRPETTADGVSYENDAMSDGCAAMLIESLKSRGFEIIERTGPYVTAIERMPEKLESILWDKPEKPDGVN